ncbi:MAG: 3-dehydroquinate synthase, partial [Acidimicrobiia bacterium]|nr:3-dehydroquinate synthase [Acidimicrobiia bacterium]
VQVSTTLLGQIDASVGGKCGVNLPEGKNLVGSFWQPAAVLCDTETLTTLPKEEVDAGMGELAKYHFLGGGRLDELELPARVAACVRLKADVVAADETETGRRAILNYGHTLAHALETAMDYRLRHGSAVAIGLPYAAELARRLGRIDQSAVAEHFRVLDAYGLDSSLPAEVNPEQLVDLFSRDKKAVDGITFVLDGPDGVEPVRIDDRELLLSAFSVYDR